MAFVLVTFPIAVTNDFNKGNLVEEGFCFGSQPEDIVHVAGEIMASKLQFAEHPQPWCLDMAFSLLSPFYSVQDHNSCNCPIHS